MFVFICVAFYLHFKVYTKILLLHIFEKTNIVSWIFVKLGKRWQGFAEKIVIGKTFIICLVEVSWSVVM